MANCYRILNTAIIVTVHIVVNKKTIHISNLPILYKKVHYSRNTFLLLYLVHLITIKKEMSKYLCSHYMINLPSIIFSTNIVPFPWQKKCWIRISPCLAIAINLNRICIILLFGAWIFSVTNLLITYLPTGEIINYIYVLRNLSFRYSTYSFKTSWQLNNLI